MSWAGEYIDGEEVWTELEMPILKEEWRKHDSIWVHKPDDAKVVYAKEIQTLDSLFGG